MHTDLTEGDLIYGPFISYAEAKNQGLTHYWTGKPCRHHHFAIRLVSSRRCRECDRELARARRNQNAAVWNAKAQQWRKENKAKLSSYNKEYASSHRKQINQRVRKHYASDPTYAIAMRLRARLYEMVTKAGTSRAGRFQELIGVSRDTLLSRLENQFLPGMSWDNMGEWHIDHIRPCASFDLTDPAQQRECFHCDNLQPLWAEDNWAKSDTWEPETA